MDPVPPPESQGGGGQCDTHIPQEAWNDQEGDWYGWVESELHSVQSNVVRINADLENVVHNADNFMREYQKRIDYAMEDFKGAIALQFAETELEVGKVKEIMQTQFSGTMKTLEDKVHLGIQNMFSAQSLETGFLWQNLVNACNANFATTLKAYVEKLAPEMHDRSQEKIVQLQAVLQGKLGESTANLRTWVVAQLLGMDKAVHARLDKMEMHNAEIRAMTTGFAQKQQDFHIRLEKKTQTLQGHVETCLQALRLLDQKVASSESSQLLADVRTNLAQVQAASIEQARRGGNSRPRWKILRSRGGGSNTPPVKPPCVTPVSDSRGSGEAGRSPQGPSVAHAPPPG